MTNFAAALSALADMLWKLVKVGALMLLVIIVFKIAFNVLWNKNSRRREVRKK
jgi:hypothetical protein